MRKFSLEDLRKLKRNNFSQNLIDEVMKDHSSYKLAYEDLSSRTIVNRDDIDYFLTKYLVENPFAVCHAVYENEDDGIQFLKELYEQQYGDFMFALKINHLRKLLCVQIMNSNVPNDFRNTASKENSKFSYSKLIEYLESNTRRRDYLSGSSEIGDFGFIKCAMVLPHEYGIQDILATVFRTLRDKYCSKLETNFQEATFGIPMDNAKYGIVAMVSEFNSFKLNGMLFDVRNPKDIVDIVDAVEIYKHTQYQYRMGFGNVEIPSNDSIYNFSSTI